MYVEAREEPPKKEAQNGRRWTCSQFLLTVGIGGYKEDCERWDPIKAPRRSHPAAVYRFHIHNFVSSASKVP